MRVRVIVLLCSGVSESRKASILTNIRLIGNQQQAEWPAGDLKGLTMFDWEGGKGIFGGSKATAETCRGRQKERNAEEERVYNSWGA
jgi:hypothetical protein